jgi:hypothetical protein
MPGTDPKAKQIRLALEELGYSAFRQDHGANYTGIEAHALEPLKPGGGKWDSNSIAALEHIAKRTYATRYGALKGLPKDEQEALRRHLKSQETSSAESIGLRER